MATEKWRSIKIREFSGEYVISESGRIKKVGRFSKTHGHWMPPKFITTSIKKDKGYVVVTLHKGGLSKRFYVHRLVAMAFIPTIDGKPHINHKDGVKINNHLSNLEWCTPQENNEHGFKTGLLKKGRPDCMKPIIDLRNGVFWTAEEVAFLENTKRKYVHRLLSEERKPNTTQYRYS